MQDKGTVPSSCNSATGVTTAYTYNAWGSPTGTTVSATGAKQIKTAKTYTSDGNMTASVNGTNAYRLNCRSNNRATNYI